MAYDLGGGCPVVSFNLYVCLLGFNVETLDYKGTNFIAWDFGGRDKSVCHKCFH